MFWSTVLHPKICNLLLTAILFALTNPAVFGNQAPNNNVKNASSAIFSINDEIKERRVVAVIMDKETATDKNNPEMTRTNDLPANITEYEELNVTDIDKLLGENWENELFLRNSTDMEDGNNVTNLTLSSKGNQTTTKLNPSNITEKIACNSSIDCKENCICNKLQKCECYLRPLNLSPSNLGDDDGKPLYESLNGYNKIRLFRPSEYKTVSHLKLSTLQQLGSTIGRKTSVSSHGTYLTRVGSGRLVELPWNQLNARHLNRWSN